MEEKKCKNCAWFCHSDGECYGMNPNGDRVTIFGMTGCCTDWAFDGLEDWEREEHNMTDSELKERMEYLGYMMHEKEQKELAFQAENKEFFDEIEERKDQIRKEILARGVGADCRTLKVSYRKGAVRWDTKWLDGYSTAHPEILKYRKQGEPSVGFSLRVEGLGD